MYLEKLSIGDQVPKDVNAVIEIPKDHQSVKYETDKDSGIIRVDRFLTVSMSYPINYGFIPNTLSGDNDPIDIMIACEYSLVVGSVINVRPVGCLIMEDESGIDEKILAVPSYKIHKKYDNILDIDDIESDLKERIIHFFTHYKDLEKNKWVKVHGFKNKDTATQIILESIERAKNKNS